MKNILLFTIMLFSLWGCAGQRIPEGGPLDTIPPEIISVFPAPNTTNFSKYSIILEFSEYVDRRSVEEAVFISPNVSNIEFDWSGTEVEILFNEELRKNTTYVVNIGTDVIDVNNRNRMAKAFTLAFSTGNKIDNGALSGTVFDEKSVGVMIFAYRLDNIKPDTLNPVFSKPDYITQTGKTGEFFLTNLAAGTYRLFAIRDEFKNLLYDPESDASGTLTDDIQLSNVDTLKTGLQFTIAKDDTTAPRISSVQIPDNRHVIIQFSEILDTNGISPSQFIITDTVGRTALSVLLVYTTTMQNNSVTLFTSKHEKDSQYVVNVQNIKDKKGYLINPLARQKQFIGSAIPDSLPPFISYSSIKDSGSVVLTDEKIMLSFNDALSTPLPFQSIILTRLKDSSLISTGMLYPNLSTIIISPQNILLPNERFSLTLNLKKFGDLSKNSNKDTVKIFKFQTIDPEQFGSIDGSFNASGFSRFVVIEAKNLTDKNQTPRIAKIKYDATFQFPLLPEGKYSLKAFDDLNKNLEHDAGEVFPYKKSEKFINYTDTIKVRARWPIDGVIFR